MRKKLKSGLGASVLEMLVALLLLALLTAGGVTATTAVMADYTRMGEAANAQLLASTAIEAISNEIRLGHGISVHSADDGILHLEKSAFFGENATLKLDDNGHLVAVTRDAGGADVTKQVLSEDAYSGLRIKALKFEEVVGAPGAGRTVFKLSFTVCSDISADLWSGAASAAPLFE